MDKTITLEVGKGTNVLKKWNIDECTHLPVLVGAVKEIKQNVNDYLTELNKLDTKKFSDTDYNEEGENEEGDTNCQIQNLINCFNEDEESHLQGGIYNHEKNKQKRNAKRLRNN